MFQIGVVAHTNRAEQAHALQETVGAVYLSMSNGNWNCEQNHRRVWERLATYDIPWGVCLEDDAQPVDGFQRQLERVLELAPTPIVSLYLGTGYPMHFQQRIQLARSNANAANACWMVSDTLLHAVGVAIRTDLLPSLLETAPHKLPFDEAITQWAKTEGHKVSYCWPSILQHQDGDTLVHHPDGDTRTQPRKAWWFHTRTEWTDRAVNL